MSIKKKKKTVSERYYANEELTIAERKEIGAGNIKINRAKCKDCGDIVQSAYRHDCRSCKCGSMSVDGGSWYVRRCGNINKIEEMTEFYVEESDGKKEKKKK